MNPYFEAAVTVACAIGSWVVAGWVTVSVMKSKMEDFIRRIEVIEDRIDSLYKDFNDFRLQTVREMEHIRRGRE